MGDLSGGERNRLQLAKLLKQGSNVLMLDEPTNDLDVETLRALEDAMLEYPGTVLVISHDRWFLDRIATHILAYEGEGKVVFFEGTTRNMKRTIKSASAPPGSTRTVLSASSTSASPEARTIIRGGMTMTTVYGHCAPAFEGVKAAFQNNFDQNRDDGASVCITIDGTPVVDLWGGTRDADHSLPWEEDTVVNVYSTTKTMAATHHAAAGGPGRFCPGRLRRQVLARVRRRREGRRHHRHASCP